MAEAPAPCEDNVVNLRPRQSKVWQFFKDNTNYKMKCTVCNVELAYHGSTTVMHEHLKRKHPGLVSKVPDGSSKQRRMDDFVLRRGICTPEMDRILTNSVQNMVVYDMRLTTKLKLKQKQMGTPDHHLIQDISTRWNSTYYMITLLLKQRWPFTATLSDSTATQQGKRYLDLKPDQWTLLEHLAKALEPFECATAFLSGESYVTISPLPPLYRGLLKSTSIDYDVAPVQAFQTAASMEMTEYCSDVVSVTDDNPSKYIIAAALDPRFRKLKFLTPQEKFSVQSKLQDLALQIAFEKNQQL